MLCYYIGCEDLCSVLHYCLRWQVRIIFSYLVLSHPSVLQFTVGLLHQCIWHNIHHRQWQQVVCVVLKMGCDVLITSVDHAIQSEGLYVSWIQYLYQYCSDWLCNLLCTRFIIQNSIHSQLPNKYRNCPSVSYFQHSLFCC